MPSDSEQSAENLRIPYGDADEKVAASLDTPQRAGRTFTAEIITTIATATVAAATIIGVFVAVIDDIRDEAREDRAAWQTESRHLRDEARADRAAWQAESRRLRDEARDDREAWQAEMRALRAAAGTDREDVSRLTGIVEQMRTAER